MLMDIDRITPVSGNLAVSAGDHAASADAAIDGISGSLPAAPFPHQRVSPVSAEQPVRIPFLLQVRNRLLSPWRSFCNARCFARRCYAQKRIDRIFRDFVTERERISFRSLGTAAVNFIKGDAREKVENLLHFKKLWKGIIQEAKIYGSGFVRFALGWWLIDDFIAPGALFLFKLNALAVFVLVGHFEPIAYPCYFLGAALLRKVLKKRPKPAEYKALIERTAEALGAEGSMAGRADVAMKLVGRGGPYAMGLFIKDLEEEYFPAEASTPERVGRREQAAKFLGRGLRVAGVKNEIGGRAFMLLLERTKDEDPYVRKVAAGTFGKFGDKLDFSDRVTAADALCSLLIKENEPSTIVHGAAARSLAAFACDRAASALSKVLADKEEDFWTREYAAASLGEVLPKLPALRRSPLNSDIKAAIEGLMENALDMNESRFAVRVQSIKALGKITNVLRDDFSTHELKEEIDSLLHRAVELDPDPTARETALWALSSRYLKDGSLQYAAVYEKVLTEALEGEDKNLASLAARYLGCLYSLKGRSLPARLRALVKAAKEPAVSKPLRFVAVDDLIDPSLDKVHQLDSMQIEALVAELRSKGNSVMYTRNFLQDRSQAPIGENGAVDTFSSLDTVAFDKAVSRLRRGFAARVPWIDFPRGRVAAERTIIPNPSGEIYIVGQRHELEKLAAVSDVDAEIIRGG